MYSTKVNVKKPAGKSSSDDERLKYSLLFPYIINPAETIEKTTNGVAMCVLVNLSMMGLSESFLVPFT